LGQCWQFSILEPSRKAAEGSSFSKKKQEISFRMEEKSAGKPNSTPDFVRKLYSYGIVYF
jgi:hypothetical protein